MGRIVYHEIRFDIWNYFIETWDVWSLMAPADRSLRLHSFEISDNTGNLIDYELQFISAVGSGGTAETEVSGDNGHDGTIQGSVRTQDTTPGTPAGTIMHWWYDWSTYYKPWVSYRPPPQMRPVIAPGTGIALTHHSYDYLGAYGWICWEEL